MFYWRIGQIIVIDLFEWNDVVNKNGLILDTLTRYMPLIYNRSRDNEEALRNIDSVDIPKALS